MSTLLRGFRREPWRLPLVASWLLMVIGGPMHPDAEAEDSLRQELATMTADDRWVPGHTLIAVATLLLAVGLWGAYRSGAWPTARTALRWGAVAISLYVVETVMHLAAAVDSDALAAGESAPVAFGHIGLALVLYPVSGLAVAWLAWSLGRAWGGPARLLALTGILGGLVHAASVPLTVALPDVEATPLFASAGMLLALWSLSVGLVGLSHGAGSGPAQEGVAAPRITRHAGAGAG